MFSVGLLARRRSVMLEDQRVSCQKTNALPAIYVAFYFTFRTSGTSNCLILNVFPMKFRCEHPFYL